MTLIKPYLIVVKSLLFFLFDSIVLWGSKSPQHNKLKLVLLIRQDAIGDFVIWLDTAKEYRKLYPPEKYKIVLVGNDVWYSLAKLLPYWDDVLPVNIKQFKTFSFYRKKLLRQVRNLGAQITVQSAFSREFYLADSLVRASNALCKICSTGDMRHLNWLKKKLADSWHTELIPALGQPMTELERNAEFFQQLSRKSHQVDYPKLNLPNNVSSITWKNREYYVLFPGAGAALRRWPVEFFAEIANRIFDKTGLTGVLDGLPNEKCLANSIQDLSKAPLEWAGTKLSELPELLKNANFLVSCETSAVYIAAAVGTPVVCILGGIDFGRFLPYPELAGEELVLKTVSYPMPCFSCHAKCIYPLKKGEPAPCITNVSVDTVWKEVEKIIEAKMN
jgi:ADP-heptose:LPS heptosyltransferase